jgi:hypothetical protein
MALITVAKREKVCVFHTVRLVFDVRRKLGQLEVALQDLRSHVVAQIEMDRERPPPPRGLSTPQRKAIMSLEDTRKIK